MKFQLFKDLGVVEWRSDYDLDQFKKVNRKSFYLYNNHITNQNFRNSSFVPKHGDKFTVQLHEQCEKGFTTSNERLEYLKLQPGAIFVGANGLPMLYDQRRKQLLKGKSYFCFDHKDKLPFVEGYYKLAYLIAYYDDEYQMGAYNFSGEWNQHDLLVSFSFV